MRLTLQLALLGLISASLIDRIYWDDVILAPPEGKTGEPSVLLFAQGASIKTSQYTSLMQQIQNAAPFPLYVGIPQCLEDNCAIPLTLSDGMKRARVAIEKAGLKVAKKTFYAGHSLGGAMLPDYIKGLEKDKLKADGLVLMGSFLTREYKTGKTADGRPQVEFPWAPTLTVGGELDGLCRLPRIAEALYTQVSFSADPSAAARSMPVVTIEGMNHMQFAAGTPPKFVADNDLKAEISEDEAHKRVAEDVVQFLSALESTVSAVSEASWRRVSDRVQESTKFTQPIVDAFKMEGYFQYLPPCYCETKDEYGYSEYGTCESTAACNGGTPWTGQYAQPLMGAYKGLTIKATDSIHIVTEEKPSCHLPHIHESQVRHNEPNWANPGSTEEKYQDLYPPLCDSPEGCTLTLNTITEPYYENSGEFDIWRIHFSVNSFDTGYLPISATQLKTKLKSRQAVWQAAGVKNATLAETDTTVDKGGTGGDRCREINDAALSWAQQHVPAKTLDRYMAHGQQLVTIPDAYAVCPGGPCWIWDPEKFKKDDENNVATIAAVAFTEPNSNPFPCGEGKTLPCPAGMHYCMLFSPARAVEWMYVDGLRNKLSTKQ